MDRKIFAILLAVALIFSCEKPPQEISVSTVSLNQATAEMIIGETVQLSATVLPSNATEKTLTWSSSKQSVASVSSSGLVTALAEGSSTITVSAGGKYASCAVIVTKGTVIAQKILLNDNNLSLVEGESFSIIATILPEDTTDKTIKWESSNPSIAIVDQQGKVSALKEGVTTIIAKIGNISANCEVSVRKKEIPVTSIVLNKNNLSLNKNESETLFASISPEDATDQTVSWISSDETVAIVDHNGKVTGISGGSAAIIAKAGEQFATCLVSVIVPVEQLNLNKQTCSIQIGQSLELFATITPVDASDQTISWKSSNTSVVTVDNNGRIKALRYGIAIITAQAGSIIASCAITVSAPDDEWDGSIAENVSTEGTGSSTDPFLITTCSQIARLSLEVNNGNSFAGKCFAVIANLNFKELAFQPIGDSEHPFSGLFDGRGKRLTNISASGSSYQGFFGLTKGATINDLSLSVSVGDNSAQYIGGIVGYSINTTIINCCTEGIVNGSDCTGSLVGYSDEDTQIMNCYSSCQNTLYQTLGAVGGLVGYNCGEITCSHFYGSINAKSYNESTTGGVVGYNHVTAKMNYCYFLRTSSSMNSLKYCGTLNWGDCNHCGSYDINGFITTKEGYVIDVLNTWVSMNQSDDVLYRSWEGIFPTFTY